MKYIFLFCVFSIVMGMDACVGRFAAADLIDDQKAMIARCEFAVLAARVPPSIPIKVICEKPFSMIDDDQIVKVDCREFCKVRGIK